MDAEAVAGSGFETGDRVLWRRGGKGARWVLATFHGYTGKGNGSARIDTGDRRTIVRVHRLVKPVAHNPTDSVEEIVKATMVAAYRSVATVVEWIYAPDWVPVEEAAFLMGLRYDEDAILALVQSDAIESRDNPEGGLLIAKKSLLDYRDTKRASA